MAVLAYLVYAAVYMGRQGSGWDEHTDLLIARSLTQDPMQGSALDPSQGRLPMSLGALAFRVTGRDTLLAARWCTVAISLATLAGAWLLIQVSTNRLLATLGTILLLLNPYFLAYSKTAFSESDLYPACFLVWSVYFLVRSCFARTAWNCFGASVALGMAIASKATLVAVLPVVLFVAFTSPAPQSDERQPARSYNRALWLCLIAHAFLLAVRVLPYIWVTDWSRFPDKIGLITSCMANYGSLPRMAKTLHWSGTLAVWLLATWSLLRMPKQPVPRCAFLMLFVLATAAVAASFPPPHVTRPEIYGSVALRLLLPPGERPADWYSGNVLFHLACIVFKSGPVLGLALIGGFLYAAVKVIFRLATASLGLVVLAIALLFTATLRIDFLQSFYMVPFLPLLLCCLCVAVRDIAQRSQSVATSLVGAIFLSVASEHIYAFPDYNLAGCQWTGRSGVAARAGLGYVGVSTVPYDGVEQTLRWLVGNVPPQATVAMYVAYGLSHELAESLVPHGRLNLIDAKQGGAPTWPEADYLVTTIELETARDLAFEYPMLYHRSMKYNTPARSAIREWFTPVYSVRRAYGLEVATVWKRRTATLRSQ